MWNCAIRNEYVFVELAFFAWQRVNLPPFGAWGSSDEIVAILALPARPPVPKRLSFGGMIQLFPGSQYPVISQKIAPEDIFICRGCGALLRFSFSHNMARSSRPAGRLSQRVLSTLAALRVRVLELFPRAARAPEFSSKDYAADVLVNVEACLT